MTSASRVSPPAGNTGNVIRDSALGIVPETLEHYLALNAAIWDAGPLGPGEIELARLRNARHTGCVLCQAVRYDVAVADGLTEDKVQLIRKDNPEVGLSERERLMMAFVDQYNLDPAGISQRLQQALLAAFTEDELLHLSLLVAWFNGSSRCAVALGGMPAEMPRLEISIPR